VLLSDDGDQDWKSGYSIHKKLGMRRHLALTKLVDFHARLSSPIEE
jgi:hypothetical protein